MKKTNIEFARKTGLTIFNEMPGGYITLENAKQLDITINKAKDAYLRIDGVKCVPIWNYGSHKVFEKKIYNDRETRKDLITNSEAKALCAPLEIDCEPVAYLDYSTREHRIYTGAESVYIPLYKPKEVKSKVLINRLKNKYQLEDIQINQRTIYAYIKNHKNAFMLHYHKKGNSFIIDNITYHLKTNIYKDELIEAVVSQMVTVKRLELLFQNITKDNLFIKYYHPKLKMKFLKSANSI